jgi:mannose-6-phosphate isomerase-like protein (cupin superfamily)
MQKIAIAEALSRFSEPWSPRIIGEVNDALIKVVKLQGAFVWHHHEHEDEMFLVVSGRMTMRLRERDIVLEPGEMLVVPRGVEQMPVAEGECHVLLVEPKTTLNTGNLENERTVRDLERLA